MQIEKSASPRLGVDRTLGLQPETEGKKRRAVSPPWRRLTDLLNGYRSNRQGKGNRVPLFPTKRLTCENGYTFPLSKRRTQGVMLYRDRSYAVRSF